MINSLGKVTGHKINIHKSVFFLYTNNEQADKEIRRTISFTIALNKYLGINLTKEVKDFHNENNRRH
jgi:hypothetical protein